MRKTFAKKIYTPAQQTLDDLRLMSRKVGAAAEAQTILMITLTAVAVSALLLAALLARKVGT